MAKIRRRRFLGADKPRDNFAAYARYGRFRFLLPLTACGVLLFWTALRSPLQQQEQELLVLQQTQPQPQLQKHSHPQNETKERQTTTSLRPPPQPPQNHNEPNKSKPNADKRNRRHYRLAAKDPREARSIVQPFDDFIHKDPLAGDVVAGPDDDALGNDNEEQGDDLVEEGNGLDDDRNVPAMVHGGGLDAWITRDDDDWQTQRKKKKLLDLSVDSLDLRREARLGVVVMHGERIDPLDDNNEEPP